MVGIKVLVIIAWFTVSESAEFQPGSKNSVPVIPGEAPFMVSLRQVHRNKTNSHVCGGVLIKPQWVLLPGHCVIKKDLTFRSRLTKLLVVAGTTVVNDEGQERRVAAAIIHEGYDKYDYMDLALLKVNQPFAINNYVKTIRIVEEPPDVESRNVHLEMYGWGKSSGAALTRADMVPANNTPSCYNIPIVMTLCAKSVYPDSEGCVGDSGSALVYNGGLIGFYLSGEEECNVDGAFARLKFYKEWIKLLSGSFGDRNIEEAHRAKERLQE